MRRALTTIALLAFAACSPSKPPDPGPVIPAFRGLLATPRQLAFTCVTPGCDSTLTVKIVSNVNRRVAIKRVVLSKENADYTVTPSTAAPFILGAASDFSIDVRFAPTSAPTAEDIALLVTYTDASAMESPDRIEPGELNIPLVRRLVGEPLLAVTPPTLNFGVIPVNARKSLPVKVSNAGFGNIALAVDRSDAGTSAVQVVLPANAALIPDAGIDVPIAFAPNREMYLKTEVEIASSTPNVDPVFVEVEGTSIAGPRVALEPEETGIDFGEVPKGSKRTVMVRLANLGGQTLNITNLSVRDTSMNVKVQFPNGMTTATLLPLARLPLEVQLDGTNAGLVNATLVVESNDQARSPLELPITGTVTEPKVQATPATISWGTIPMGWAVTKPVEVKNIGYGKLTLKRITFVGGTSMLYTLKNLPALPMELDRNQRVAFEVEFRAETAASFMGAVSIETDDPANPFTEVALSATGGSCATGCPIANGTPSCARGTCEVGMCNTGWYDNDKDAANGCECREIGTDPGDFCSSGLSKGTLADTGASTSHTGIIAPDTDIDFIRFFGSDESQFLRDDYDVRIRLVSNDPNISMCVYRYDTDSSVNECYLNNETCNVRDFRKSGSLGPNDGAMYYIKVFRKPNTAATCTSYTVYMSNG